MNIADVKKSGFTISGFTMVRNGTRFDYPYLESLRSLLPLVDELIINVGKGDDNTLQQIEKFCESEGKGKAQYFESDWGWGVPEKMKSGLILSEQTNLALDRCTGDWCVYLQADEVLHENDCVRLREAMHRMNAHPQVEALLFDYIHFYGSYGVVQNSRSAYRREIRAFKKSANARSIGDAQSFRGPEGRKLRAVLSGAKIYHYGWVRPPEAMREKTFHMDQLYHGTQGVVDRGQSSSEGSHAVPQSGENYKYKKFWGLQKYSGPHPDVMSQRNKKKSWNWDLDSSPSVFELADIKKIILDTVEKISGIRFFEYRSYKKISVQENLQAAVVITTYNNPRLLGVCLASFINQSYRDFDIYIADDGSTDETKSKIELFRDRFKDRLHHFWHPDTGYKKSVIGNQVFRQLGNYPVVICVDHDTIAHHRFVEDHVRAHQSQFKLLFMGRRVDLGPQVTASVSENTVARFQGLRSLSLLKSFLTGDTHHFFRCIRVPFTFLRKLLGRDRVCDLLGSNFSITRSLLSEINGYNEDYQAYWGEDGDLFVRARNSGATLRGSKALALQLHMYHPRLEPSREHQALYQQKLKDELYRSCERGIRGLE